MNYFAKIIQAGSWDLHTHSTCSDGTFTPQELIVAARQNQLQYLSITDHDTIAAYDLLQQDGTEYLIASSENLRLHFNQPAAVEAKLLVIPGVEISSLWQGKKVDVLGYFLEHPIQNLQPFLTRQQASRKQRNLRLIKKVKELGYEIEDNFYADLPASAGRVHLASALVGRGYFTSISEAFDKLLLAGRPGFVAREACATPTAITEITKAGGMAVIAHPQLYGWCKNPKLLRENLCEFNSHGLVGVEAFHSQATEDERALIQKVATTLQLITTGGSDFHGNNKVGHDLYHGY